MFNFIYEAQSRKRLQQSFEDSDAQAAILTGLQKRGDPFWFQSPMAGDWPQDIIRFAMEWPFGAETVLEKGAKRTVISGLLVRRPDKYDGTNHSIRYFSHFFSVPGTNEQVFVGMKIQEEYAAYNNYTHSFHWRDGDKARNLAPTDPDLIELLHGVTKTLWPCVEYQMHGKYKYTPTCPNRKIKKRLGL